jgi:hypothetical protein
VAENLTIQGACIEDVKDWLYFNPIFFISGVEDAELKVECRTTLAKNIVRSLFHTEVPRVRNN